MQPPRCAGVLTWQPHGHQAWSLGRSLAPPTFWIFLAAAMLPVLGYLWAPFGPMQ